jgi:DNA-binding transcriptional LysR family regulator
MDTKKIRAILTAAEHKSFSKAANELSYTPSALTHIADNLERELGVKIIERTPLGISLSPQGEELYDYMVALLNAEKKLMSASHALSKAKENHLRIGTFSSISQNLLPEIIKKFRTTHPDIKISVAVEDSLHEWLENDFVDIIFADELSFGIDNVWLPIKEDPFVAVVPSNILKGKKSVSKDELYHYTYISINEKILNSYFDKSKFANVLNFESIDNVSVLYMIQQKLGFSLLPQLMINKRISGVKTIKLKDPICRTIGFAYKKTKHSQATKMFIDYLIKQEINNT